MPAQLLALTDGPSILLDKPILLLGRHPECDIQLNSRKVSRRHCCIAQVRDYLVVRDLGSTNGIRVNGARVLEGKLKTGDELTIGNFRYQVAADAAETPKGAPAKAPPPPKPAVNPVRTVNDDLLENAEEPVPLDESAHSGIPAALPAGPPRQVPPVAGTISDSGRSPFLPDNLTLLPNSGAMRKPGSETG
jgi:pSer/pThr/pTyr-binding forkhead associated (FHA) protein